MLGPPAPTVNGFFGKVTSAVCEPVGSMTWAETRALFGLDDVALKGLLSVKQSGSNAIERTAGNRRILVVAGRPCEGPFTIRFADLRRGATRTAT